VTRDIGNQSKQQYIQGTHHEYAQFFAVLSRQTQKLAYNSFFYLTIYYINMFYLS